MSEHLNSEEEDLLKSALSSAFTPAPLPRQSAAPESTPEATVSVPEPVPQAQLDPASEPESTEDVWKGEYEAHVAEWRRRSAEQRQKAEEKRAEWEAIREQERKEGKLRQSILSESAHSTSGWEKLTADSGPASVAALSGSPSPGDVRDFVSGEGEGGHSKEFLESALPGASGTSGPTPDPPEHEHEVSSHPASEPESKQDKWDSMTSSMTSSFPSMSFPSDPHSPISSAPRTFPPPHGHGHGHGHDHHPSAHGHSPGHHLQHHHHHHPEEARTATLSVFDTSLSPKTRTLALLSSVAINVLLPFVNGVMLGFGEIFAKNVVQWLGWRVPGTASAASSRGAGSVALGRK